MTDTGPPAFSIWHCRALGPEGVPVWYAVVQSSAFEDGANIELPEAEAVAAIGDAAVGYARVGEGGTIDRLEVTTEAAPKAPPLWFVEVHEPDAQPIPAVTLVAYTGHDVEPGTLLDRDAARKARVRKADQLAAFRWYPSSGFGDQVYVSPQWRRRTIGTGILAAAGTLSVARGWARLWGSGQRTADGQRLYENSRWTHMSEPQTHILPPMTPFEDRPT